MRVRAYLPERNMPMSSMLIITEIMRILCIKLEHAGLIVVVVSFVLVAYLDQPGAMSPF